MDVILYSSNNELLPFLHWSMSFQNLVQYLRISSPCLLLLRLTSPAGMHNSKHSVGTFLALQHFSSCDRSVEGRNICNYIIFLYRNKIFSNVPNFFLVTWILPSWMYTSALPIPGSTVAAISQQAQFLNNLLNVSFPWFSCRQYTWQSTTLSFVSQLVVLGIQAPCVRNFHLPK